MAKKVSTIEELGDIVQGIDSKLTVHANEVSKQFESIGSHLVNIESKLEELAEISKLREQVERMRENIREKLHVDV